jgi:purine-binding chemotaxis protein CheW
MGLAVQQIESKLGKRGEKESKYLTFSLNEEEYGIGVLKIKEIIGMMPIAAVPKTPDFVKGIINLRGKMVPVIDLRVRFGISVAQYVDRSCIVVVEIDGKTGITPTGIIVDSVSEVLNIKPEDIESPPSTGTYADTEYILGTARMNGRVKILLDIQSVLTKSEVKSLERLN